MCVCSCAADTEPMKNVAAASAVARNPPALRGLLCSQLTGGGPRMCVCVCDSVCMLSQYRERKALSHSTPFSFFGVGRLTLGAIQSINISMTGVYECVCVHGCHVGCISVCMCTLTRLKTIKGIVQPKIKNLSSFALPNIDI